MKGGEKANGFFQQIKLSFWESPADQGIIVFVLLFFVLGFETKAPLFPLCMCCLQNFKGGRWAVRDVSVSPFTWFTLES